MLIEFFVGTYAWKRFAQLKVINRLGNTSKSSIITLSRDCVRLLRLSIIKFL